jgi:excisionase family DNA binding protein
MRNERFHQASLMTTTEVGELLAVHPSTVKRWCNDGDLPFHKTDGGHRRIRLDDTLAFAQAHGIPTILEPFSPHEPMVWAGLKTILTGGSYREIHDLTLGWLESGELELITALFVMLGRTEEIPLAQLFDEGVAGLMREVGERWGRGTIGVGQEHLVSQAVVEALSALSRRLGARGTPGRNGGQPEGVAVVGSMEGDQHHIGSLCIRVLLEAQGWRVAFLGPSVPVEEFAALQSGLEAHLVCVSFTPPHAPVDVERAIRILGRFYRPERPYALALGGTAVDPSPLREDRTVPFEALGVFKTCVGFLEWLDRLEPRG